MFLGDEQEDRRGLMRLGVNCSAEIICGDGRELAGRVVDLSGSGISIECDGRFAVGETMKVRVVPDKPVFMPLEARVKVIHTQEGSGGSTLYGMEISKLIR